MAGGIPIRAFTGPPDLSGSFDSIGHTELMKSVTRRVSDRHLAEFVRSGRHGHDKVCEVGEMVVLRVDQPWSSPDLEQE
jgi:hypothetical protein